MATSQMTECLEQIRSLYRSRQSNQILVTGNIWDIYPLEDKDSPYVTFTELLKQFLSEKMIIVTFDITRGIQFANDSERDIIEEFYAKNGSARGTEAERRRWFTQQLHESMVYPILALTLLRELCSVVRAWRRGSGPAFEMLRTKPLCILVRYAETLLPGGPLDRLSENDRQKVTLIREWFSDPDFVGASDLVLLISDTIADINLKIRDLPRLAQVTVPYPDMEERRRFIRLLFHRYKEAIDLKETQKALANLTAGLRLTGIEDIFLAAVHREDTIDRNAVIAKVNEMLTRQVGDYIEILEPDHTLADVMGNTILKRKLKDLKVRLKSLDAQVVPSGILVSGPNGVGKTFIFVALSGESGRIPVVLKNLRSKWFGETDVIFEKINNVLRALGNVLILVDEADTAFGGRGEQSHETEQRLFGNVLRMMSETSNRGRIVWLLMTARPDKLEPDFKRPGRCGLHIPVFDPTGKDRDEFFDFVLKKVGFSLSSVSEEHRGKLNDLTTTYSGADFKELSSELLALRKVTNTEMTIETVLSFIEDWRPTDISDKRRLQTLHAVLHCSYRSLLPTEFLARSREDIVNEIARLESGISF